MGFPLRRAVSSNKRGRSPSHYRAIGTQPRGYGWVLRLEHAYEHCARVDYQLPGEPRNNGTGRGWVDCRVIRWGYGRTRRALMTGGEQVTVSAVPERTYDVIGTPLR